MGKCLEVNLMICVCSLHLYTSAFCNSETWKLIVVASLVIGFRKTSGALKINLYNPNV